MRIVEVDPFDRQSFDAWHDCYLAAERHGHGSIATPWLREESRVLKQARTPASDWRIWATVDRGQVVACAGVGISRLDNLDLALAKVWTAPEHRRRGHGSTLVAHVEEQVRSLGRTKILAEVTFPLTSPADGAGYGDVEFARRHGYELALLDVQRVLDLPVDEARLTGLAEEVAPHHAAYTLRSFRGPVPEELVAEFAALTAALPTEAPVGELGLEEAVADVVAFRAEEATLAAQRRTRWATVAVAADGTLAGYTDICTSELEPERAWQWGTLVHGAHRGARLGLALKVHNLRVLQEGDPRVRQVHTWNAQVNAHMVGVNDRLGYRPVARLGEFKKLLTA